MSATSPEASSPAEPPSGGPKRPVAGQQRSKVRILVDIMRAVAQDGEARPTRILYGANLSSDRLGRYLDELVAKKLLDRRDGDGGTRYSLTKEGHAFLAEFRRIEEFSSAFGIEF
ncbi:MAG: hypothetical protein HY556_04985 [Euryarchaeota archaeon]|nr:hypothetical protein [Euryarchaeota archaeon]